MSASLGPAFEQFMATAEAVAQQRPEVDPDMAREVFREAATSLHNALVFDGLDDHDTDAVVSGLCSDLVTSDPGAAIRARSEMALTEPGDLHDPEEVWAACLTAATVLQL